MKKSRKRMLALSHSAAMVTSLLAGCSGGGKENSNPSAGETRGAAETTQGGEASPQPAKDGAEADGDISLVMSWWGNQTRNERTTKPLLRADRSCCGRAVLPVG